MTTTAEVSSEEETDKRRTHKRKRMTDYVTGLNTDCDMYCLDAFKGYSQRIFLLLYLK